MGLLLLLLILLPRSGSKPSRVVGTTLYRLELLLFGLCSGGLIIFLQMTDRRVRFGREPHLNTIIQ